MKKSQSSKLRALKKLIREGEEQWTADPLGSRGDQAKSPRKSASVYQAPTSFVPSLREKPNVPSSKSPPPPSSGPHPSCRQPQQRGQAVGRDAEGGRFARLQFVVFPELALTTFFPRWWMESEEEVDKYSRRRCPSPETLPLFELARSKGIGSIWAMPS